MRFSIIVPVYNVEKYIGKCLDSLVDQSFEDYEIVVVDDETPDNSMAVVSGYQEHHPDKFRLVHQKNKGLGGARNTGAAVARGEYLLFVDSDDYIHRDTLKTLNESLEFTPSDILVFQYAEVTENGELIRVMETEGADKGVRNAHTSPELLLMSQIACNKAYRREFYVNCGIGFPERTRYEDSVVRIFLARASSVSVCPACLYYYVQHTGSITHSKVAPWMTDVIKVSEIVREELQKAGLYDKFKAYIEAVTVADVHSRLFQINTSEPENPMQATLTAYIIDTFPDYSKNPLINDLVKQEMACLCTGRFRWFHYRYNLVRRAKTALMQLQIVESLNRLRKKRARKKC